MSPGDFLAIMYLAYQDQEAERKRKLEEEAKKKGKHKDIQRQEKELNAMIRKGVRIPANVIDRIRKQRQKAERAAKAEANNPINPNFNLDDLIDEM